MPPLIRVPDPDDEFSAVKLVSDLPGHSEFARDGDGWQLELPDGLQRLEYMLEVERAASGKRETILDPSTGLRTPGVFGEKSVWLAAGYEEPWWMSGEGVQGDFVDVRLRSRWVKRVRVWTPGEASVLLLAHDGDEYEELSHLVRFVAVQRADYAIPPCHVALLAPHDRDETYSANAAYARALVTRILPAIARHVTFSDVIGMGASLGGLAMLHAQRHSPGTFAALFLQSGSFFVPDFDAHESGLARYERIVRFVRSLRRATPHGETIPVVMTCGAHEENIHNNRLAHAALLRQGYDSVLHEVGDVHNYVAWRDAFDPPLVDLLSGL